MVIGEITCSFVLSSVVISKPQFVAMRALYVSFFFNFKNVYRIVLSCTLSISYYFSGDVTR